MIHSSKIPECHSPNSSISGLVAPAEISAFCQISSRLPSWFPDGSTYKTQRPFFASFQKNSTISVYTSMPCFYLLQTTGNVEQWGYSLPPWKLNFYLQTINTIIIVFFTVRLLEPGHPEQN